MPNSKNYSMREKILDGLLKRREGVSMQDIIRVVNHQLSQRGVPEVRTKDTILNDMTEISNKYHVNIEQIQDGFDRRIIRYRYEKPDFSIYAKPFTAEDEQKIQGFLNFLSQFEGMPQMDWVRDFCSHFDVFLTSNDAPVVEFEESDSILGRAFFTGLFHAIIDKKPISLTYQAFGKKARTHLLYPYFLKQFKQRWYLIAKNSHHLDSISAYALDRMITFHQSLFDPYVPIDVDVHEYFNDVVGIARMDGEPQTIKFHVDKHELPYLQTRPIHHSQKIVGRDKTGVFMTIHVIPNTELLMELMSYGDGIIVKTKCKLRSNIMRKLGSARKKYGSSV